MYGASKLLSTASTVTDCLPCSFWNSFPLRSPWPDELSLPQPTRTTVMRASGIRARGRIRMGGEYRQNDRDRVAPANPVPIFRSLVVTARDLPRNPPSHSTGPRELRHD